MDFILAQILPPEAPSLSVRASGGDILTNVKAARPPLCRPAGWTWLIDGDRVDHHMICAVTDVAHILVTRHLHTGDLDAAKHAATIALTADPDSETARLDLAGIMVHEGHTGSARRIVADALGEDADLDLTPRATDILNGKDWLKTG